MKNKTKKIIANFLAIVFLLVSSPMSVFADEIDKITSVNEEIYKEEVINEDNVIEKTENKTTYELDDGLKREVIYDTDVRFYDEDNKLQDYDPSLIKIDSSESDNNEDLSKYKYENKAGDKKVYLPEKISTETPILLENDKNQIKVTPIIENETFKVNVENEKTLNIYDDEVSLPIKANYEVDDNTTLEYISQDNGIKENLVLNEKPESNVFEYEITVDDNLVPKKCEVEESIVFNDKKTGETKASIDVPFMNDKTGKAYSEDITYDIEKSKDDNNKYILTMTLSEDYLNDKDRVYPIEVDPTITWTGESNLIDTYILSNSNYADINFYGSGTTAFPIGYTSSMGTCRSLIRSLDLLDTVKDKYVEKATLTMYETSSCDANMTVNAYRIIDGWSKATVTWNNKPRYSTSSGIMGTVKTTGTLYKSRVMDITTYARGLANGTYSADKGLMLKTNSDTSSSAGYCKFYGGRHSSSSLRPKFTVDYYDGPTIASSVKLSKTYLKSGDTPTLSWTGISSKSLDRVEYRIANRDDVANTTGTTVLPYETTGISLSDGSAEISKIKDLPEGCYKIFARGVDSGGISGTGKGVSFHIDNTAPTIGNITLDDSLESPVINWEGANDLHLKQVQYKVNNGTYKSMGISESGTFTIPTSDFTQAGDYTIKVSAIDKSGNRSEEKTFTYNYNPAVNISEYTPKDITTNLYYGKNLISWDINNQNKEIPGAVSYYIYRGTTENFTPSDSNLIANNVKNLYYVDMEVGVKYYYKIKAVRSNSSQQSEISTSIAGTLVNSNEFDKRLGTSKDYLGYFSFETPNGNGAIEKSKGNLNYSQTDTDLPSEQLDYSLSRSYNSQSNISGMFGLGFSDTFHKELYKVGNDIVLSDSDGSIYKFEKSNNVWSCSETKDYELIEKEKAAETEEEKNDITYELKVNSTSEDTKIVELDYRYQITTKDNTIYRFNENGQLITVTEPNKTCIIYSYDSLGRLTKLNNSNGIEVNLEYKTGNDNYLLDKIILPDNTVLSYDYSDGKLTKFKHSENDSLLCLNKVSYEFEYNTEGLLNIIKDAKSNSYSINYNSNKATNVTYPNGENYNITYNNLETSVNKKNENNDSIYTEKTNFDTTTGKVIQETDVDGNITKYSYNFTENPYLVTATTKNIDYQELVDNILVNKTKEVTTVTKYNENEDIDKETDEEGNITNYKYEATGEINESNPTSIITTSSNGKTISSEVYEYDTNGNETKVVDNVEKTTTINEYNDIGEVEKETTTEYSKGDAIESQVTQTYEYDNGANATQITAKGNEISSIKNNEYDSMGRLKVSYDESTNSKITYDYDFLGREIKSVTSNIEDDKIIIETKTCKYDENGTLIEETINGDTTKYEYDTINRLVSKTISSNGSITYNTIYSYTELENLNTGKTQVDDEKLYYVEKTYNGDTTIEEKYYDKNGNLVREKSNGTYKDYVYDNNKNTIATFEMGSSGDDIDLSNKKISLSLYNEDGQNVCNVSNAVFSDGKFKVGDNSIINKSTYDSLGNTLSSTDGRNFTTNYTYDSQSRLKSVTTPDGSTTSMEYDIISGDNTSSSIIDAEGHISYEILNLDGLTVSTSNEGDTFDITTSYTYDKKGNKTKEIFSNGDYKQYSYNVNNKVEKVIYYKSSGEHTLATEYTYDVKGNVLSMIDYKYDGNDKIPYHYTYYGYDNNNRLVGYSEINSNSKPLDDDVESNKLEYTYDVEGNITEIKYPSSLNDSITSIKFEYNKYNWITGIKAKINGMYVELRDYSYNNDGTINNIKDYSYTTSGIVSSHILKKYTYDELNRVSSMKYYNSDDLNNVKESYTYTYDKNSNIKSEKIVNNYPTKDSEKVDETRLYEYDNLNRLTNSAIVDNKTNKTSYYSYTYDKVGNMTSRAEILADGSKYGTVNSYNQLNQLKTSVTSDTTTGKETSNKTYTYDENGNNTKEVDSVKNITKEMTYDVDNRLDTYTQIEGTKTTTQNNLYNGNGQRVQKSEGDNTINYFYQNGSVLYTTNKDGDKTSHNFIGVEGNTISTIRYNLAGLEYYIYNKDIKGSTSNLVDNNGNAKISYIYSDFGETEEVGDKDFYNEMAYTGGIYDNLSNLYYLNARYYNPEDARFITQDTYRGEKDKPDTLHLYSYCANNPINYIDPSGHRRRKIKLKKKKGTITKSKIRKAIGMFVSIISFVLGIICILTIFLPVSMPISIFLGILSWSLSAVGLYCSIFS